MTKSFTKRLAIFSTALLCLVVLTSYFFPVKVNAAGGSGATVRVGYYENEVFQEGASADLVKTGYAYEYY